MGSYPPECHAELRKAPAPNAATTLSGRPYGSPRARKGISGQSAELRAVAGLIPAEWQGHLRLRFGLILISRRQQFVVPAITFRRWIVQGHLYRVHDVQLIGIAGSLVVS